MRDLRISVTDRCNFRCGYCMPREAFGPDHAFLPRAEILDFDEIERVVGRGPAWRPQGPADGRRAAGPARAGGLVARLATVDGIEDLTLTHHRPTFAARARDLAEDGLHRVTVSLDASTTRRSPA